MLVVVHALVENDAKPKSVAVLLTGVICGR